MPRWRPVGADDDDALPSSTNAAVRTDNGFAERDAEGLAKQEEKRAAGRPQDQSIGAANGASGEAHESSAANADGVENGHRSRRRGGKSEKSDAGENGKQSEVIDCSTGSREKADRGDSGTKGEAADGGKGSREKVSRRGDKGEKGGKGKTKGKGRGAAGDGDEQSPDAEDPAATAGGSRTQSRKGGKGEKGGKGKTKGKGRGAVGEGEAEASAWPSTSAGDGDEESAEAGIKSEDPADTAGGGGSGAAPRVRGPRGRKKVQHEGEDTADRESPGRDGPAPQPLDRMQLVQQLKLAEQRVDARTAAVTGLRNDIRRMQQEIAQAAREEAICHDEAQELLSSVGDRRDKHRGKHFEIEAEVALHAERAVLRRAREREFREDLESAAYQRARAKEATDEVEVEAGRWRKASAEQADRAKRAETKLKALEARRAEYRAQSEKWHRQALVAQREGGDSRTQVQELRLQAQSVEFGASRKKLLWQAVAGVLFIVLMALLLEGRTPFR